VLGVMTLEQSAIGVHHFQRDNVIALLLNAANNLAHQRTTYTVGLDEDQAALNV